LYERSVAELMIQAADELEYPASRSDVVGWFAEHYPDVKASTVRAHVVGLNENDPNRHHYASLARRQALFRRDAAGSLSRSDPTDAARSDDGNEAAADTPPLEFALEAYLEEFLLTNWDGIDWGRPLELWESETGELGHQLVTPVGRLDFLCRDTATGALVVVELKRGRPSDRVVGQAARYMGWVRAQLARPGQPVDGIIVAHDYDLQLNYAISSVPGLTTLTYRIDFALAPAGQPEAESG
jgi:hypothetical protein